MASRLVSGVPVYRSVMRWNTSAAPNPYGRPRSASRLGMRSSNAASVIVVDGVHRRLELALVGEQRGQLALDVASTSSTWFGSSASHSSSAVGRWWARPCSGKKCGSRAATTPSHTSRPAWR